MTRSLRTQGTTPIDEYAARLHAAGWSAGETSFATNRGPIWQVDATNGEHVSVARAPTQAGAWRLAVEQVFDAGRST
jgi:hypothetical protein